MRKIMSALVVLLMMFAMVSIGEAGTPYPCIASPAYTHYTDAKNGSCPPAEERPATPDAIGY